MIFKKYYCPKCEQIKYRWNLFKRQDYVMGLPFHVCPYYDFYVCKTCLFDKVPTLDSYLLNRDTENKDCFLALHLKERQNQ